MYQVICSNCFYGQFVFLLEKKCEFLIIMLSQNCSSSYNDHWTKWLMKGIRQLSLATDNEQWNLSWSVITCCQQAHSTWCKLQFAFQQILHFLQLFCSPLFSALVLHCNSIKFLNSILINNKIFFKLFKFWNWDDSFHPNEFNKKYFRRRLFIYTALILTCMTIPLTMNHDNSSSNIKCKYITEFKAHKWVYISKNKNSSKFNACHYFYNPIKKLTTRKARG